jgi:hypothetical protein
MEDIVYRYSATRASHSKCIDIAQASTDPEVPAVAIAIDGRSVILDQQTTHELAKRLASLVKAVEAKPY